MKKSLMHSGLLFSLAMFLTGCGDSQSPTVTSEFGEPARFKIAETTWQTSIPLDWSSTQIKPDGTILVAQSQDQNFILAQKSGDINTIKADLLNNSVETFFDFALQSENQNQWVFRGKLGVNDPMRVFHQKILAVPGTDSYLMGLCSYDYWEGRSEVCSQILERWGQEVPTNN